MICPSVRPWGAASLRAKVVVDGRSPALGRLPALGVRGASFASAAASQRARHARHSGRTCAASLAPRSVESGISKAQARLPAASRRLHAPVLAELIAGVEVESTRDAAVASQLGAADAGSAGRLPTSEYCKLLGAAAGPARSLCSLPPRAPHAPQCVARQAAARRLRDGTPYREWLAHSWGESGAATMAAENLLDAFIPSAGNGGGRTPQRAAGKTADAYMSAMRIEVGLFAQVPGATSPRRQRRRADFDGTITSQPDSTADLLRVAAAASADSNARTDEVAALVAAFGVKKAARVQRRRLSRRRRWRRATRRRACATPPAARRIRDLATPARRCRCDRARCVRSAGACDRVATRVVTLCPRPTACEGRCSAVAMKRLPAPRRPHQAMQCRREASSSVLRFDGEGVCVGEFEAWIASGADCCSRSEAGLAGARRLGFAEAASRTLATAWATCLL